MEFLTFTTILPPAGTPQGSIDALVVHETRRVRELVSEGTVLRLWRPPLADGEWKNVGLWSAPDETALWRALDSLPLRPWMTFEIVSLANHPNDPAIQPPRRSD